MTLPRSSGILAHITSLPSDFGIGDIGHSAIEFVDFLSSAGQRLWQILPTGPIGEGNSPYKSPSTFAGNPLFLCPHGLEEMGLLTRVELHSGIQALGNRDTEGQIDFQACTRLKKSLIRKAFNAFEVDAGADDLQDFEAFCDAERSWLEDYALYEVLAAANDGRSWMQWSPELAGRDHQALVREQKARESEMRLVHFEQYLFHRQWNELKAHTGKQNVQILGDLPIYVAQESADVWSNQSLFQLDDQGYPTVVAGVPPDYFSATGQYWGNPIYDWDAMERTGYDWWVRRLSRLLDHVDMVRIDHFRGLESYWEIPFGSKTAVEGRWVQGPGARFLEVVVGRLQSLPVIAEDLGVITEQVTALRDRFGLPGMAVLPFSLMGGEHNDLLPHRLGADRIAYTGTHDNDTFLGWWDGLRAQAGLTETESDGDTAASDAERDGARHTLAFAEQYLRLEGVPPNEIPWKAIESLMASGAGAVIVPVQDLLSLGRAGRMNVPGTERGNWGWCWLKGDLNEELADRLRAMTARWDRTAG